MTINCQGKLVNFDTPKILGILNLTPDSFYDGGRLKGEKAIIEKASLMLQEGADFIDLGGYSSRPGATDISIEEEKKRVVPVVKLLTKEFPDILLSIDTFRTKVAKAALDVGAAMINDISAGNLDSYMMKTIAEFKVPYIMMHMKVIVDAGFGFAKTIVHNYELLNNLNILQQLEVPILTGISRKSMIYKTLKTSAEESLNGTSALHMVALQKGSNILRVHDVAAAKECILLHEALKMTQNV